MIKPLTSLRFFFALMIFTSHLSFENSNTSPILKLIFKEGYIGVSFFFILSGFIIAYNYQYPIVNGSKSKYDFYVARIARIYPLHLLTFILAIPLTLNAFYSNKLSWIIKGIMNVTLIQSYIPLQSIYFTFNSPSWSISDELFFYIMFPFLIGFLLKIISKRYWIMISLIILIGIILLFMKIIPKEFYHQLFYINPLFRIIDFILGIFLYNLYLKLNKLNWKINFNLVECISVLVLIIFFSFHPLIPEVMRYSVYYWIPMCLLILMFSFQQGILSQFLSNKILIILGEISYGFYMFHALVLRYFYTINDKLIHLENDYLIIFITFSTTLIISYFSFIWFEKPTNNFIKMKFMSNINSNK